MTNQESTTQASESQESSRSKSGKRKAIFKRSKPEGSSEDPPKSSGASELMPYDERDPQMVVRIQERAYWLFQAGGFKHGHDLEHWLEAERQVAASSDPRAA